MKTATITFHAAHNYGSMLQAYALQHIIRELGHENRIINLRTDRQKRLYSRPFAPKRTFLRQVLHNVLYAPFKPDLDRKYELFERFLSDELSLTEEFASLSAIEGANLDFDCYIAGGDQIWNTAPIDFDWSYYLPFVETRKKISYAVSMGPDAKRQVSQYDRIKSYLSSFSDISVRETGTKSLVEQLVPGPIYTTLDPVLLLSKNGWLKYFDSRPLIKQEYILVYVPGAGYKKRVFDIAKELHIKTGLPIYTTLYAPQMLKYPYVKKYLAAGPWEFLNILINAKLVLCGSFHAVVFSALFEKPFLAVDGDKDNRMRTFLENMGLMDRVISEDNIAAKVENLYGCDFSAASRFLERERKVSLAFLKHAIEK